LLFGFGEKLSAQLSGVKIRIGQEKTFSVFSDTVLWINYKPQNYQLAFMNRYPVQFTFYWPFLKTPEHSVDSQVQEAFLHD